MPLSDKEIADYHRDGLVVPADYRVPSALLQRMHEAYDRLLHANRNNPAFSPDFILGPHIESSGSYGVQGDREWLEFARIPEVVEMVGQVAGEDLILWGVTIFGKPAGIGKATPWHQDGDYYPIEPLATCSVWIALDGSTPEQGCMRFVPGSHRERRLYAHHWEHRDDLTLGQVIDEDQVDLAGGRDVILEPGQISLHDIYLVHGSAPNLSERRRVGLVLRIMPASSYYNHDAGRSKEDAGSTHGYSNRPLFLLSGRDHSGRNDFTRGH